MGIPFDWHVHSRHSPCGKKQATLAAIRDASRAAGVGCVGIADHFNCPLNGPALRACRREYDEMEDAEGVYFGLEVSCLRVYDLERNEERGPEGEVYGYQPDGPARGELVLYLPDDILMDVQPHYILAGAHGPLGAPPDRDAVIRQYHRQHMFCVQHPIVDVLVHPWWWRDPIFWETAWMDEHGHYTGLPWFDDFTRIPASMHEELASAALEHHVALEVNAGAFFTNPHYTERFRETYIQWLARMRERGLKFALATDSHGAPYSPARVEALERVVEKLELTEEHLWRPGMRQEAEASR